MLRDNLGLDDKDVIIVNSLTKDPETSQAKLAKLCDLSQPSVNVRIHKLRKKGVLVQATGVEFNRTQMHMVRVDFSASDPSSVLDKLRGCSFFVNGFTLSGTQNVSALVVGHNLIKIDTIINEHVRNHPGVSNVTTSVVVGTSKPFICQLDLSSEMHQACQDKSSCQNCPMHPMS